MTFLISKLTNAVTDAGNYLYAAAASAGRTAIDVFQIAAVVTEALGTPIAKAVHEVGDKAIVPIAIPIAKGAMGATAGAVAGAYIANRPEVETAIPLYSAIQEIVQNPHTALQHLAILRQAFDIIAPKLPELIQKQVRAILNNEESVRQTLTTADTVKQLYSAIQEIVQNPQTTSQHLAILRQAFDIIAPKLPEFIQGQIRSIFSGIQYVVAHNGRNYNPLIEPISQNLHLPPQQETLKPPKHTVPFQTTEAEAAPNNVTDFKNGSKGYALRELYPRLSVYSKSNAFLSSFFNLTPEKKSQYLHALVTGLVTEHQDRFGKYYTNNFSIFSFFNILEQEGLEISFWQKLYIFFANIFFSDDLIPDICDALIDAGFDALFTSQESQGKLLKTITEAFEAFFRNYAKAIKGNKTNPLKDFVKQLLQTGDFDDSRISENDFFQNFINQALPKLADKLLEKHTFIKWTIKYLLPNQLLKFFLNMGIEKSIDQIVSSSCQININQQITELLENLSTDLQAPPKSEVENNFLAQNNEQLGESLTNLAQNIYEVISLKANKLPADSSIGQVMQKVDAFLQRFLHTVTTRNELNSHIQKAVTTQVPEVISLMFKNFLHPDKIYTMLKATSKGMSDALASADKTSAQEKAQQIQQEKAKRNQALTLFCDIVITKCLDELLDKHYQPTLEKLNLTHVSPSPIEDFQGRKVINIDQELLDFALPLIREMVFEQGLEMIFDDSVIKGLFFRILDDVAKNRF